MSNINCNKVIYFSLGYYKRCLQCAKNSHKSAFPFNVENHYIVNKTEKALGKGFTASRALQKKALYIVRLPLQQTRRRSS